MPSVLRYLTPPYFLVRAISCGFSRFWGRFLLFGRIFARLPFSCLFSRRLAIRLPRRGSLRLSIRPFRLFIRMFLRLFIHLFLRRFARFTGPGRIITSRRSLIIAAPSYLEHGVLPAHPSFRPIRPIPSASSTSMVDDRHLLLFVFCAIGWLYATSSTRNIGHQMILAVTYSR